MTLDGTLRWNEWGKYRKKGAILEQTQFGRNLEAQIHAQAIVLRKLREEDNEMLIVAVPITEKNKIEYFQDLENKFIYGAKPKV